MNILFYSLLFLAFYIYLGYFLLIILLGLFFSKKVRKSEIEPEVSLLIAAYNEEKDIAKKIENSLLLDYPKDKLNIIVVSDGSTDRTDEIVRSFESRGIKLFRVEGRVGKTEARNIAVKSAPGEIILFSDATTIYQEDLVKKLVRNFADSDVGMVTGQLIYRDDSKTQMGIGQKIFWKYESLIKKSQTNLGTLTGSVGCITAFRKKLYRPLPRNIIEDFTAPLFFVMNGSRVVYEEEAICFEETTKKSKNEWSMRVRVIRGGMSGMLYAKKILNPFIYPMASFQLISHKILRWLVPVFMLILLVVSTYLVLISPSKLIVGIYTVQMIFYLMALYGYILESNGKSARLYGIPFYFVVVNAASFVALIRTATSELESNWEPQRNE